MTALLFLWAASLLPPGDPPAADVYRFPPRQAATAWREFGAAAKPHLEARAAQEPGRWAEWSDVRTEALYDYQCWNTLENAWHQPETREGRELRQGYLADLRRLLGPDAYARGEMPDPVPWRAWRSED